MFTEEFYSQVIRENGYDAFDFEEFNFGLRSLSSATLTENWLCHHEAHELSKLDQAGKRIGFTTGFGLSGVPHIGTLSQILNGLVLQREGYLVQMVLGDLDAFNARNQDEHLLRDREQQYRQFILNLGFDDTDGILRNQWQALPVLLDAYLLGKHLTDDDFANTKEYLSDLYVARGIYQGITFPVKLAILLMTADFVSFADPLDYAVVVSGLDEHRYIKLARHAQLKSRGRTSIGGIYSRMNRGFNGHPKMSKSIPGSGILLDMHSDGIARLILSEQDNYDRPEDSIVFQIFQVTCAYFRRDMQALRQSAVAKDDTWSNAKHLLIEQLSKVASCWPS